MDEFDHKVSFDFISYKGLIPLTFQILILSLSLLFSTTFARLRPITLNLVLRWCFTINFVGVTPIVLWGVMRYQNSLFTSLSAAPLDCEWYRWNQHVFDVFLRLNLTNSVDINHGPLSDTTSSGRPWVAKMKQLINSLFSSGKAHTYAALQSTLSDYWLPFWQKLIWIHWNGLLGHFHGNRCTGWVIPNILAYCTNSHYFLNFLIYFWPPHACMSNCSLLRLNLLTWLKSPISTILIACAQALIKLSCSKTSFLPHTEKVETKFTGFLIYVFVHVEHSIRITKMKQVILAKVCLGAITTTSLCGLFITTALFSKHLG